MDNDNKYIHEICELCKENPGCDKIALGNYKDYDFHDSEILIKSPEAGKYFLVISNKPSFSNDDVVKYATINVTDILPVGNNIGKQFQYRFHNRTTGQPLTNVRVQIFNNDWDSRKYKMIKDTIANSKGEISIGNYPGQKYDDYILVINGKDSVTIENRYGWQQNWQRDRIDTKIFTDRKIYRPGQTVYWKLICYSMKGNQLQVMPNEEETIKFSDANWNKISSQEIITDEYGSAHGEFKIPTGLRNGSFKITSDYGQAIEIKVEEYKKPTFEVKINDPEGEIRLNDNVSIKCTAKAFSGDKIMNGKARYSVIREPQWRGWYYWQASEPSKTIATGESITNENGEFQVSFKALSDNKITESEHLVYRFTIKAEVTDINGETQYCQKTISAGYRSLFLSANIDSLIVGKKFNLRNIDISSLDINGNPVSADIKINIFQQNSGKLIKTFNIQSPGKCKADLSAISNSGHYLIELSSVDKYNRPVRYEKRITAYHPGDKISIINPDLIAASDKKEYQQGDIACVYVGTALSNVYLYYSIYENGKNPEYKELRLNRQCRMIEVPITENSVGGMAVQMYFVKNNQVFTQNVYINVPPKHKKLNVEFMTFRDKLKTGDSEKWRIKITDSQKKPIKAQFLTTLYDEALDAIIKNNWNMEFYDTYSYELVYQQFNTEQTESKPYYYETNTLDDYEMESRNEWFDHWPNYYPRFVNRYGYNQDPYSSDYNPEIEEVIVIGYGQKSKSESNYETLPDFSAIETRENFCETALFQPDIVTDSNGELYVEFTIPESLTRWRMLGLAHTKDMKIGTIENHLVTNRDFTVTPNLPRFLRCGDEITIPVKINSSLTDSILTGSVKMEILNSETQKPISPNWIQDDIQDFELMAKSSAVVHFHVRIPEYNEPVIIKVVGISGNHSDGEQHQIPVLTDRELVTESMTMSVRGGATKKFEFKEWKENQSQTASIHSLTLEYSNNPAWYAVSSLPWLSENPYDCMEQTFSKLFANSVSALIIENNPDIKDWIDKKQEMSQFRKLMDIERINAENEKFISKLLEAQTANGAWPWFNGMRPNKWITQYLATGFGKMRMMGIKLDNNIYRMMNNAIIYLDNETVEDYKRFKEQNILPGFYDYQYLYMRSYWNKYPMDANTKEAYDFLMKQARKNWKYADLRSQALLCSMFDRAGEKETAQDIIKSLSERAIHSDEFGMYFRENINGMLFHESNIETQAQLIEAFQQMGKAEEVEELKIWLIKNRQANRWKTTKATTEAVYSMFLCGNKIKSDEPLCTITLGGNTVDQKDAELGTGYFKEQWQKEDMDIKMADITVQNPNNHISYGAVYRQYFEKLDNIKAADNKLKIEKKIYRQTKDANGKDLLSEITEKTPVKPGDKVTVRFIITTDRDLEYVHLKDMRAAGFELLNVISRTKYQDGMFYYESTKDASENFFIEHLNKGTYVFEYPLVAVHSGNFSVGIATIQCMYAPEFVSHSEGMRFSIGD